MHVDIFKDVGHNMFFFNADSDDSLQYSIT